MVSTIPDHLNSFPSGESINLVSVKGISANYAAAEWYFYTNGREYFSS
jgi:hypothetical protein